MIGNNLWEENTNFVICFLPKASLKVSDFTFSVNGICSSWNYLFFFLILHSFLALSTYWHPILLCWWHWIKRVSKEVNKGEKRYCTVYSVHCTTWTAIHQLLYMGLLFENCVSAWSLIVWKHAEKVVDHTDNGHVVGLVPLKGQCHKFSTISFYGPHIWTGLNSFAKFSFSRNYSITKLETRVSAYSPTPRTHNCSLSP